LTVARLASARGNPEDAIDALEQLLRGSLFLYDGQAKPTLLTREDGTVEADLTVVNVEGEFILLIDGLSFEALALRLAHQSQITLRDLRADHQTISLHGPFAWELLGEWLGRRAISLPPLGALTLEQCLVIRGGRTGEFGYEVVLPQSCAAEKLAALSELGLAYDLATVSLEEIDAATIEVGGFSIRSLGGKRLSPFELQLGWRLPKRREPARPSAPPPRRSTCFVAEADTMIEGSLLLEGGVVGEVLVCYRRALATSCFGIALVDGGLAHSGLRLVSAAGAVVHTRSAPLVRATSLSIRPQVDRYRTHRSTP
jgi:glycine cleavage system aminomethyltransferase T